MSERVTWEPCPGCSRRAAVGWAVGPGNAAVPDGDVPVEFDCPAGCAVDRRELHRLFSPAGVLRVDGGRPTVYRTTDH